MSKTILLADDSLTIQKVVELTFSDTDFEVVATSGGDELLAKLPEASPDIVICDTIMPGTDGYAVCQSIKSEPSTLHIPVILMTGTFEPFDRDRALAAGCSEIITKPFEARNLVETVERLISGGGVAAPAPEAFEGSIRPPEAGAVMPPAPPAAAPQPAPSEFGTMLSPPTESAQPAAASSDVDEGLDFTSTGFAEMEAAGEQAAHIPAEAPDHGLDFDSNSDIAPQAPAEEPEDIQGTQPMPVQDTGEDDPFAGAGKGIFGGDETDSANQDDDGAPAEESSEPVPTHAADEESFMVTPPEEPTEDSIEVAPPDEPAEESFDVTPEDQPVEESIEVTPPIESVDEEYQADEREVEPAEEAIEDVPVDEIPAADVLPDLPPPVHSPADEESEDEVIGSAPLIPPVEPVDEALEEAAPEDVAAEPIEELEEVEISDGGGVGLSDADVDRIARRVVELAADRLEKIAWDVIPDMAEIVVRERLRELEEEIERGDGPEPS